MREEQREASPMHAPTSHARSPREAKSSAAERNGSATACAAYHARPSTLEKSSVVPNIESTVPTMATARRAPNARSARNRIPAETPPAMRETRTWDSVAGSTIANGMARIAGSGGYATHQRRVPHGTSSLSHGGASLSHH